MLPRNSKGLPRHLQCILRVLQVPTIEGLNKFNRLYGGNFIYLVGYRISIEHYLNFLEMLQNLTKYFQGILQIDTRSLQVIKDISRIF